MSNFVFRNRFWLIGAIFWIGFGLYTVDRENVVVALARALDPGASDAVLSRTVRIVFGVGALAVILAAALRTWATAYLKTDVVHDRNLHSATLVASGPYRHVRNPLYLGLLLMSFAFAMMASRSGFVVIVLGIFAFQLALILHEEHQLSQVHAENFLAYRRAVPRLIPSLTPRVSDAGTQPRWGQAFVGEAFMWIFAIAAVVWVLTLNMKYVGATALAGVIAHIVIIPVVRRRAVSE
ncbi:MAG: methyltransferase [bacterium]